MIPTSVISSRSVSPQPEEEIIPIGTDTTEDVPLVVTPAAMADNVINENAQMPQPTVETPTVIYETSPSEETPAMNATQSQNVTPGVEGQNTGPLNPDPGSNRNTVSRNLRLPVTSIRPPKNVLKMQSHI